VGKPEGKRSLEIPRRRWEDNIKTNLKEHEWGVVDSIHLAQNVGQRGALFNMIMNFEVTKHVWYFLNS
jgi:hypothetical protein